MSARRPGPIDPILRPILGATGRRDQLALLPRLPTG
jgi:hypothetical protein